MWFPLLRFIFVTLATCSNAANLQLSDRLSSIPSGLQERTSTNLTFTRLLSYTVNVTLNGQVLTLLIDSGSSDIWVSSLVPSAVPQQHEVNVSYASGSASGNIMSAICDLGGFPIDSQFYIQVQDGDAIPGADGLLGLAPSSGSAVRNATNSSAANPPLDRIFTSYPPIPPYIGLFLQRPDDSGPEDLSAGNLAIGEVLPDYQDVLDQPRLPVTLSPPGDFQFWQTLLDVDGIIGPNGEPIEIKTQVPGAQAPNATVVFDTGYTFPQVPSYVAEALYSEIPGASVKNIPYHGDMWTFACNEEVNATFMLGGVEFPVHPLDLSFDGFQLEDDGEALCVGTFQPHQFDGQNEHYDMILGTMFLRNTYIVVNFGDLLDGATPSATTAYIQLLPITNATEAAQEFVNARGLADNQQPSPIQPRSLSHPKLWLISLIVGAVLLLLLIGGTAWCYRLRRTNNTSSSSEAAKMPSYRPIHDPSPQAAYDMYMTPGLPRSQDATTYWTAWDARYV